MSSIVQIKDSAYDGLQSLRVYGNTTQNLWVNPSGTKNGVTATANTNGSVTLSGTASAINSVITKEIYVLRVGSTYTLSIDKAVTGGRGVYVNFLNSDDARLNIYWVGGSENSSLSVTFTVPSTAAYAIFGIGFASGSNVSGTYRVMLNEGSEAKPWCPPGLNSVGDGGSVDIVTAGKNLLVQQETLPLALPYAMNGITFSDNGDGGIRISGTATNSAYYNFYAAGSYPHLPPGTYTSSTGLSVGGIQLSVGYFDPTSSYGYRTVHSVFIEPKTFKLDSPKTMRVFIGVMQGTTVDTVMYPQIELGSKFTGFESFDASTTPIDLQGHTLNSLPDGTRDELHIDGGGNVVLEKRTWSDVFDGTEGWVDSTTRYGLNTGATFATTSDTVVSDKQMADTLPILESVSNSNGIRTFSSRWVDASITSMLGDLAGFKAWLGNNNTTIIYKLAEPQTIDLGTIDLPKLRKKPLVNTIWANGAAEGTGFSLAPEIDCEYNRWSIYCDGFKTHGKHSYFDMGCCIAARDTGAPEKKSVTVTVPYMSGFYDLSKLYGAIAFEARQLTYRFEFVEDSREELQQKKSQFLEWLSQVHDEEIADDDIPGRHFIGSLSEWEFEEGEEGQSGSLEVTFNCQPFLEADEYTTKTCNAGSNTVTVEGQAVNAYAKTSSGTATIQIGGVTQSVGTSEIRLSVQLQPGDNAVTVTGSPVVLRWKELTV